MDYVDGSDLHQMLFGKTSREVIIYSILFYSKSESYLLHLCACSLLVFRLHLLQQRLLKLSNTCIIMTPLLFIKTLNHSMFWCVKKNYYSQN